MNFPKVNAMLSDIIVQILEYQEDQNAIYYMSFVMKWTEFESWDFFSS